MKLKATKRRRPFALTVGLRLRPLSSRLVAAALKLPEGRLRQRILEWSFRELVAGSQNRRDYEPIRAFAAPDYEYVPPPELAVMLTDRDEGGQPLTGVEFSIRAIELWFEAWGDSSVTARYLFDLGDGRFLVLHDLHATGRASGAATSREYAELFDWHHGMVARAQQWLSWAAALEAADLSGSSLDPGGAAGRVESGPRRPA